MVNKIDCGLQMPAVELWLKDTFQDKVQNYKKLYNQLPEQSQDIVIAKCLELKGNPFETIKNYEEAQVQGKIETGEGEGGEEGTKNTKELISAGEGKIKEMNEEIGLLMTELRNST